MRTVGVLLALAVLLWPAGGWSARAGMPRATGPTAGPTAGPGAGRWPPTWPLPPSRSSRSSLRRTGTAPRAGPLAVAAALDLLGAALGGSAGLIEALDEVARGSPASVAADLRTVAAAVRWGRTWEQAWQAVGPQWAPARRALVLAEVSGAPPAGPLRRAAADLRAAHAQALDLGAARLGVRLVLPLGLAYLPAFVLLTVVPLVLALAGSLGG